MASPWYNNDKMEFLRFISILKGLVSSYCWIYILYDVGHMFITFLPRLWSKELWSLELNSLTLHNLHQWYNIYHFISITKTKNPSFSGCKWCSEHTKYFITFQIIHHFQFIFIEYWLRTKGLTFIGLTLQLM